MVWEIVFMLLVLKIPIVYLCVVIWWAIKAEPQPPTHAEVVAMPNTPTSGGPPWRRRPERRRPLRPHTPGHGDQGSRPAARSGVRA